MTKNILKVKKVEPTDNDDYLENLNGFLSAGFYLNSFWNKKYSEESKDKENFNSVQFKQDFEDKINEWFRITSKYIADNFKNHYYFHFVETKKDAMSIGGLIGNLSYTLEKHLFALEDIIVWVEEKESLSIKREIAEKEYQAGILYKVTYSDHTREIKLNNIILAKPDFDSENDNCFQYILANPGRPIGIEELEQAVGSKLNKRLAHIVRDLGFVSPLNKIFFPVVTKDKIMFMNPISREYAIKHDLPAINFKKL